MGVYALLAEAMRYPVPGRLERLEAMSLSLTAGAGYTAFRSFLEAVRPLALGEWEELYTRTWDLNPLAPPYIGFQMWGEDYRRGTFLAHLQGAYRENGIDSGGELPDHLVPVLSYLDAVCVPTAELGEVFSKAVEKMAAMLHKRDATNPYLPLLREILAQKHLDGAPAGE